MIGSAFICNGKKKPASEERVVWLIFYLHVQESRGVESRGPLAFVFTVLSFTLYAQQSLFVQHA